MPVLNSTYKPLFIFRYGFISTVYSGLFRKVKRIAFKRESLCLPDGDFLDIDWTYATNTSSKTVCILLHGLEGNSQRPYITGMVKILQKRGIDCAAVNFRGCNGTQNLKLKTYNSGDTTDLQAVIASVLNKKKYSKILLNGYSLGGNVILKYLGETANIPVEIKAASVISVPCDLYGSMLELHKYKNKAFEIRFKNHLIAKLKAKRCQFPNQISDAQIKKIKRLRDFDTVYTAPVYGFKNASDYYFKSSSLQVIPNIKVPTLIINALNDSFLSASCYPVKAAKNNEHVFLEMPIYGGHVSFIKLFKPYYNEDRSLNFFENYI